MKNPDFTTSVAVDASVQAAFNAINNVRAWWSENIEGDTDTLNGEFTHRDKYLIVKMKITHLSAEKIVWDIVESHNTMFLENPGEWNNTKIVFEIIKKEDGTEIEFIHSGLKPNIECYKVCSNAWSFFIKLSLKGLIEKGSGAPISPKTGSYSASITVDNAPGEVFDAITNVRGWWSEQIEGNTGNLHDEFIMIYKDIHRCKIALTDLVPEKRIVWQVMENYFKFTKDKTEWTDTRIIFEIFRKNNKTELLFTHEGLTPAYECFKICSDAWAEYIQGSLRKLITTGEGQPNKE